MQINTLINVHTNYILYLVIISSTKTQVSTLHYTGTLTEYWVNVLNYIILDKKSACFSLDFYVKSKTFKEEIFLI